jgi:hypothetical protein
MVTGLWRWLAASTIIGVMSALSAAGGGAYLSEIWLAPASLRASGESQASRVGPLIEIADITGPGAMDLVIVDATSRSANYGRILQVIPVSPSMGVHVIYEHDTAGSAASMSRSSQGTVLSGDERFAFLNVLGEVGRRSVLLFEGRTGLTPLDGSILGFLDHPTLAVLVDAVTFGDPDRTQPVGYETVLDPAGGEVFIRPMTANLEPSDRWLVGSVDGLGRLTGEARGYPTNPGAMNAVLLAGHMPEPSSAAIWCLLVGSACVRRSRRGHGLRAGLLL